MNPIDFKKLIDFSDQQPILTAIENVTKLNNAFDVLISEAVGRSAKYAQALQSITDAAGKLEKQVTELDAAEKSQQDTIAKSAAESDKLLKQNQVFNDSLKQTEKEILLLTEQQKKLVSAKEQLGKVQNLEAGSLNALKVELKEAVKLYESFGNSVSQSVKQDQLKKITDLSRTIRDNEQALKDAKKGVDLADGSYKKLAADVAAAKDKLKEMKGGVGSTSEEFKKLQGFIKDGSDKLKEFDKAIGDNQRDVGRYEAAVDALDKRFGGLISNIKNTGKELIALATNPFFLIVGLIIGAFALASAAVKTFFEVTGEGEDILGRQAAVWEAFKDSVKKSIAEIGKAIVDFFGENGVTKFMENAFVSFATAVGGMFPILIPILKKFVDGTLKEFDKVKEGAVELFNQLDDLGDRITVNLITRAQKELIANKLLDDSRNKLKFTDEQRLQFVKDAAKIQESVSKTEIGFENEKLKLLQKQLLQKAVNVDFLKQEIKFTDDGLKQIKEQIKSSNLVDKQKEELAQQIAKIIDLDAQYTAQQKRNNAQIINLTLEIERAKREAFQRELDSRLAIDKFLLDAEVKRNDEIVKDEDATLSERLDALNNAAEARIQSLEIEKQMELNIIQRAAEERIRAEGKVVTNELLAADKGLQNQRELLGQKYVQLVKDVNKQTLDAVENNVFKQLTKDAKELQDDTATIFNNLNRAVEVSFQNGNLSLRKLLGNRKELQREQAKEALLLTIDSLEKQKEQLEIYGHDVSELDAKLSAARLALIKSDSDRTVEALQRVSQAGEQLAQQAFTTATDLINASAANHIASLEARLQRESEAKDRSIEIAGEDAQAKAFIEDAFAQKQKEIQAEINKEKRKAAIYDKAIAITQATVNTALGVSRALGSAVPPLNFILAALVGAAGALQIASIAAAPIPQFFRGTDYSPEGFAEVAERGREIIIDPSGEAHVVENRQLTYLQRGSKVIPNPTTESILKDAERYGDGYLTDKMISSNAANADRLHRRDSRSNSRAIVQALNGHTKQIVNAIKDAPQDIYDEKGFRHYENSINVRIQKLNKRYTLNG